MKNYLTHKRPLAVPDWFRPHLDSSVAHSPQHKSMSVNNVVKSITNAMLRIDFTSQ